MNAVVVIEPAGRLKLNVEMITSELLLVGVYLKWIFEINAVAFNLLWVLIMAIVANVHTLKAAKLRIRPFFLSSLVAILLGTAVPALIFICLVIQPEPLLDAQYLVPIWGMLLGNCLRSNIISLDRFFSLVRDSRKVVQTRLALGATLSEALRPFMRQALRATVMPIITTISTLGIVSLPGMMTGQILGGSLPMVAIQYQICIMIAIFSAISMTASLNMLLSLRIGFDRFGNLRRSIFQ